MLAGDDRPLDPHDGRRTATPVMRTPIRGDDGAARSVRAIGLPLSRRAFQRAAAAAGWAALPRLDLSVDLNATKQELPHGSLERGSTRNSECGSD